MEFQNDNVDEVVDSLPQDNVAAEIAATTDPIKPEGWDQVDFTPDQQKRFDRVYKQLKDHERNIKEYRDLAREQAEAIAYLQSSQMQIAGHMVEDKFAQREQQLTAEQKSAFESGDLDKYNKATRELGKLDIQREQAQQQKQPQQRQPNVPQQYSANDVVDKAIQEGEISAQEANEYRAWSQERDEYGDVKRPWTMKADENALRVGAAVFSSPAFSHKSFNEKLMEIDRLMGVQTKQTQQSVMPSGTNLTRPNKLSNIKLSPEIEMVAVRTKFAGPGKSDAEHIEAWKKQAAKAKGGR